MRKVISTAQALEAARLSASGFKLDQIVAMLGLQRRARSAVWRAIREVTTAQERIAVARRTGCYDTLSVGEAVAAMARADEPEGDASASTPKN